MNAQDVKTTQALLAPSARNPIDAATEPPKSAFRNIRCKPQGQNTSNRATIYCSFTEAPGQWMGNPDTWWTVSLTKTGGRWFITDHGQG
jgi:hypothetical protein